MWKRTEIQQDLQAVSLKTDQSVCNFSMKHLPLFSTTVASTLQTYAEITTIIINFFEVQGELHVQPSCDITAGERQQNTWEPTHTHTLARAGKDWVILTSIPIKRCLLEVYEARPCFTGIGRVWRSPNRGISLCLRSLCSSHNSVRSSMWCLLRVFSI